MEVRISHEKGRDVPVYLELDLGSTELFDSNYREALQQACDSQALAAQELEEYRDDMATLDFHDICQPVIDRASTYKEALGKIEATRVAEPTAYVDDPRLAQAGYDGIMMGMKFMAEDSFGGGMSMEKENFLDELHEGITYKRIDQDN